MTTMLPCYKHEFPNLHINFNPSLTINMTSFHLIYPTPSVFLTMMMEVSSAVLAVIMIKLSMNHVYQMTPLLTPIALRVSLRRSSFSSTILFTVMETE